VSRLFVFLLLCSTLLSPSHLKANEPEKLIPVNLLLPGAGGFRYAGYYAAIDQGYYGAAGLKVTLVTSGKGPLEPINSVLSGLADFSVAGAELSVESMKGRPVVAVASLFQTSPAAWLVLADRKIDSLRDLVGREVEQMPGTSFAELQAMFLQAGIDPARLKKQHGKFGVAGLLTHQIDALEVRVTDTPFDLAKQGIAYRLIRSRSFGVDFYGDILFTRKQLVKQQRPQVEAFRQATMKGWIYALNHQEEMIQWVQEDYAPEVSVEKLRFEASEMVPLIMPDLIEVGHMSEARWSFIAQTQRDLGLAPKDETLESFIYDPNPKTDYSWVFQWLGFALIGFFVLAGVVSWVIWLNRNLRLQIEERHLAEAELRKAEERQARIIETAPSPMLISELCSGALLYVNEQARQLLSLERQATLENTEVSHFFAEPEANELFFEELKTRNRVDRMEIQLGTTADQLVYVMISGIPIELEDKSCLMIGMVDITPRKALEEELRTRATIDGLTGCFNRSHFFETAENELTRSLRYKHPLTVVMLDIDHFKGINDTWGHEIGDLALISFCDAIRKELRTADIFGRIGGEEFVVVLPETDCEVAEGVAERMRRAIENMTVAFADDQTLQFTVSIGISGITDSDAEVTQPIARADAALYEAKNGGRNQVVRAHKDQI